MKKTELNYIRWYKKYSLKTRILFKVEFVNICGVDWQDLTKVGFSLGEKIKILYEKLKYEGFEV